MALRRIQNGEYAKEFVLENRAGAPGLLSQRRMTAELPIEKVGESSSKRLEARLNGGGPQIELSGTNGGITIGSR